MIAMTLPADTPSSTIIIAAKSNGAVAISCGGGGGGPEMRINRRIRGSLGWIDIMNWSREERNEKERGAATASVAALRTPHSGASPQS